MSFSRCLEELFYPPPDDDRLVKERLHYENLKSLTDKQMDVIRYLYMRLNIIDGKAGYLLRINALTASVISVLIAFSARADGTSIFVKISNLQLVLLVFALSFTLAAFVFTFAIGELEYDHVTEPPKFFNQTPVDGYSRDRDFGETLPDPKKRLYVGAYSASEADTIVDIVRTGSTHLLKNPDYKLRTFKDYEDLFFKITIARLKILKYSRLFVSLAVISSMAFIVCFAAYPPSTTTPQRNASAPAATPTAPTSSPP